jgi:hypothetical protein
MPCEDFEDEELDEIAFPENGEAMINIFRKVIIKYYEEAQPRSKLYNVMARVRENLMFWTRYKRPKSLFLPGRSNASRPGEISRHEGQPRSS